jgi:hypothetical protein
MVTLTSLLTLTPIFGLEVWIMVGAEGNCASVEEFTTLLPKWNETCNCRLRSISGISENGGGNPAYSITIFANSDFAKVDLACIERMAKSNDRGWMSRKFAPHITMVLLAQRKLTKRKT